MVAKTKLRCAGESHQGVVRQNNEDRLHFDPDRGIFIVIDGIGGQAAGEKAADIAMGRVRARLERQTGTAEERIREAIAVANNEILRLAGTNPEWQGMACVLTVAVVENGGATIGHVGDSRLYKIRRGAIRKITHDHSPVGEREDKREISEADAMRHPRRNEVFRDVGSEPHEPDDPDFIEILKIPFEPDSALVMCSDGLSDQVTSAEILRTVTANAGHPYGAVHELIDAANDAGGKDNVTVLIVEGDQFAAAAPVPAEIGPPSRSVFAGQAAMFVYGLAFAAAICAGLLYFGVVDIRSLQPPGPQTLHVGSGGFSTIAEALAKARPGDTVEVPTGEYAEQIRVGAGVTLKGQTPDVPILRASRGVSGQATAIAVENARGVRVSGFRILGDEKGPLATGVLISNANVELEDTEIVGAGTGIEIRGNSPAVVRGNTITDCREAGIRISGTATPWLRHNTILHNGKQGVWIDDPARPVLIGNIFGDNGGKPVGMPDGMDAAAIQKYNFFLPVKAPARRTQGAAH